MKIVLLDRDGTVIVEPPDEVVDNVHKVSLFPDTIEALTYLSDNNFAAIFITNQVGIAKNRMTFDDFWKINDRVLELLAPSNIKILKTYLCPHAVSDNCSCRKPKPKLILEAAEEFHIDLTTTYMVGDRESDILAGMNAGTKTVLIQSKLQSVTIEPTYKAPNLLDAAKYIVSR